MQNIAEGSQASGTSKKFELKLTNVARASLEELKLDYEDFLRHRNMTQWAPDDRRCADLIARRCKTVHEVTAWVREIHARDQQSGTYSEIAANAARTLIVVACSLLDRQIAAQAQAFEKEGGFTERMYRIRQRKLRQ